MWSFRPKWYDDDDDDDYFDHDDHDGFMMIKLQLPNVRPGPLEG